MKPVELITPEGIALHLALADPGERIAAFILDLVFMALFLLALTALSAAIWGGAGGEAAGVIWLLGFFLLRNFYFVLFELRPRGATPGKRALGIRVAARTGGRLGADAIVARNLVRELELFLPLSLLGLLGENAGGWLLLLGLGWALIFALLPLFNRERLRVGDLLAGTFVVRAPRRRLLADLGAAEAGLSFTAAQLGAYGIKELHVLEDVLRVRNSATMAAVAARIRTKIGWVRGIEGDQLFLETFYAGLRARLERGLLFGARRADKFAPDATRTPPPGRSTSRPR